MNAFNTSVNTVNTALKPLCAKKISPCNGAVAALHESTARFYLGDLRMEIYLPNPLIRQC